MILDKWSWWGIIHDGFPPKYFLVGYRFDRFVSRNDSPSREIV